MSIVIAIIGVLLTAAWLEQMWALRRRKRKERTLQWWKDPDDEGDY